MTQPGPIFDHDFFRPTRQCSNLHAKSAGEWSRGECFYCPGNALPDPLTEWACPCCGTTYRAEPLRDDYEESMKPQSAMSVTDGPGIVTVEAMP